MEYTFHTVYDRKAMKALAKGLRKTLRARRNRRSRIMGTLVVLLGMLLIWSQKTVDLRSIITAAAMLAIVFTLLREDDINGAIAKKRGLPGLDTSTTTFREESYHSITALGETTFHYDRILALAETADFFLLLFSPSHGQVYSKAGMTGGTEADFRAFLEERTNLTFKKV